MLCANIRETDVSEMTHTCLSAWSVLAIKTKQKKKNKEEPEEEPPHGFSCSCCLSNNSFKFLRLRLLSLGINFHGVLAKSGLVGRTLSSHIMGAILTGNTYIVFMRPFHSLSLEKMEKLLL